MSSQVKKSSANKPSSAGRRVSGLEELFRVPWELGKEYEANHRVENKSRGWTRLHGIDGLMD
ncbi:uncharacterized protein EAE98_011482 [Botrytis deweyae]|uniref:Uncharacterized protein n=1 Tax=Botrytis deweyae TaxID=2478750 RepID=A0ABQ7I605_9HELO|nr:uncharacterized protein EAE98_011482 [Botrytis deweyae]KAF7914783.1 hypothetical protein EAE98_011482 [Botrytis deweyae]